MLEMFKNLEFLSLRGCNMKNLNNMPSLPMLHKIDLSNNALRGDRIANLGKLYPNL